MSVGQGLPELEARGAPFDSGELGLRPRLMRRMVLVHQIHISAGRQLGRQPTEDRTRFRQLAGHEQVPHQHATQGEPVLVHEQLTHLVTHRFNDAPGCFGIFAGPEILRAQSPVRQLEIGQVNVNDSVHQSDALEAVVSARVIDQRQAQSGRDRVGTALVNAGFSFPMGQTTINLAPADIKKEGPSFDRPIAA